MADAWSASHEVAPAPRPRSQRTPFATHASRLLQSASELHERVAKLETLASKSSPFDDPAVEIGEMSALIQRLVGSIGRTIQALEGAGGVGGGGVGGGFGGGGAQFASHARAVVDFVKEQYARSTSTFENALKQREAIVSAKEVRGPESTKERHTKKALTLQKPEKKPSHSRRKQKKR